MTAPHAPRHSPVSVPRVPYLGRPEFRRDYYEQRPVILERVVRAWPAATRWTPEFFAAHCGDVEVTVRAHRRGGGPFLAQVASESRRLSLRAWVEEMRAPGPDGYAWSLRESAALIAAHPELLLDVGFESLFSPQRAPFRVYLWLGPPSYVTGFHTDEEGLNLLAHLRGHKSITLFAPEDSECLYPHTDVPIDGGHYAEVDAFAPDLEKHPKFADAHPWVADLGPGDLIYIPRGWWHRVVSHTESVSVSGMAEGL